MTEKLKITKAEFDDIYDIIEEETEPQEDKQESILTEEEQILNDKYLENFKEVPDA